MKLITRISQLCAFDLVEESFFTVFNISKKFFVRLVFLLHVIYVFVNLKYQFSLQVTLFNHPDIVGNTTNLIEMLMPLLCQLTIVLESMWKRKMEEKIACVMAKLNCSLDHQITIFPLSKFFILFVVNSLIYVAAYVLVYRVVGSLLVKAFHFSI